MPQKSFALVAAIDIGTTFSGYAFSTRKHFKTNPLKIVMGDWRCDSIDSAKTLTCILFNKDKRFQAFGYDAEDEYAKLADGNNHKRYFFYRRFKMKLFTEHLHSEFPLEDEMGNKMPAIDVFSACIKYLRERVMEHSRERVPDIVSADIKWVLTVPAFCSDTFKPFVEKAAERAGFDLDKLLLVHEPEAASTYCRYFITPRRGEDCRESDHFRPHSKYLVLDAGGSTIDTTIHQVQDDGSIKELYAANVGDYGGTHVDKAFRDLLSDVVKLAVIDDFQTTNMNDYNRLFREFEARKRNTGLTGLSITLPFPLIKPIKKKIKKYRGLTLKGDKLLICSEYVCKLFTEPLEKISNQLKDLIRRGLTKDVSTILLVGGFSDSEMLQCTVKEWFPNDEKFIIPAEPGLAVLKGAVIFGHEKMVMREYLIVAAIDFGTTYSGYAFSTRSDFERDPLKIVTNTWTGDSLLSLKTSTCVLFNEDKTFKAFGFDADEEYAKLATKNNHKHHFFFRRFKMKLFNKTHLQRNVLLEDEMGNKMPAIDVFSACFKYLREHLLERSRKQFSQIADTDFRWVLTLPAIWNDTSKQFMREAAEKAGYESDQLLIALEPEAASLCCRHLPMNMMKGNIGGLTSKYLVLDAGGGTIDITIHQGQDDGSIKELYAANGGDWGGTYIDKAFRDLLSDIVGSKLMDKFQKTNMYDYIGLFRYFEVKKRKCKKDMSERITFKVPIALDYLFEKKHEKPIRDHIVTMPKYSGRISWIADKLQVDSFTAKNLYTDALEKISVHLESLFTDDLVKDVSTILMVGGFSESEMLQCMIREHFPNKNLIIPAEPGLAVLKGAVIFGHDPQVIKERRCRFTYGVASSVLFDETIHPVSKRFFTDTGVARCRGIFSKQVELGQPVVVGESQVKKKYWPINGNQTSITFNVYSSYEKDPSYVDEPSCKELGSLSIDLGGTGLDRSATVQMTFSDTELHVAAINTDTGDKVFAKLDFLG